MTKSGSAMNINQRATRRRRRMRNNNTPSVSVGAVMYRGPITMPSTDTTTVVLLDNAALTSSAGSVVAATYNNNPSNARNFAEYATSWEEYRVLGMKFTYDPVTPTPNGTLLSCSGYQSIVHGTATPSPSSLAQAASIGIARSFNGFKPFTREWRMSNVNEAAFVLCASPASTSDTLFVYSNNATLSQTFGNIRIEYLIQFKTHVL
jgi:hypothetical protein